MKKFIIFPLLAVLIFYSCTKKTDSLTLGIDVQSSFNQDNVRVLIDGQKLLHKQLQTNYILGVCYQDGQIVTTTKSGEHEISVIVNNTTTKTETINLHDDLYIGINYDPQRNEISFLYSAHRFMYD